MPIVYMSFWSVAVIGLLTCWRLRDWGQVLVTTLITAAVLFFTYTLFTELSLTVGLNPHDHLSLPQDYLYKGFYGWLALLIMPLGWLGPVIGLAVAEKMLAEEGLLETA